MEEVDPLVVDEVSPNDVWIVENQNNIRLQLISWLSMMMILTSMFMTRQPNVKSGDM